MSSPPSHKSLPEKSGKLRFSQSLGSSIVTVTLAGSRVFYLHSNLLVAESERFSKDLNSGFKESAENAIELKDEDPNLFGFFIEYLYRNQSILSREIKHYSEYVVLARLYALGERIMAPNFQSRCLWRFTESLSTRSSISDESVCELLRIACTEITERVREDPMRAWVFWYGATKIASLQKLDMFRQMLCDIPDLGNQVCLWVDKDKPERPNKPNDLLSERFAPESEYSFEKQTRGRLEEAY